MSGLPRSDVYRILLPGAILVALIVYTLRLILFQEQAQADPTATSALLGFVRFLEDPFRGFAVAFSLGLVLYFFDLGYASPEYHRGLPSDYLRERLEEAGLPSRDYRDLFFVLFNQHMSDALRHRALLYGDFFRIGVEAIAYTLTAGVALPVGLYLYGTSAAPSSAQVSPLASSLWARAIAVLLILAGALLVARRWREATVQAAGENNGQNGPQGMDSMWMPVCAIPALSTAGWAGAAVLPHPAGRVTIVVATTLACGLWLLVRMRGSAPAAVKDFWRGTSRYERSESYPRWQVLAVDISLALSGVVGVVAASSFANLPQILGMAALPLVAMLLSFFRKHERQYHGVLRNQRGWIDSNWSLVEELATELPDHGSPSSSSA